MRPRRARRGPRPRSQRRPARRSNASASGTKNTPSGYAARCSRGGGDRQTRLSDPTRPRERDQADVVILELRGDQRDLLVAPDERCELRGKLHGAGLRARGAGSSCSRSGVESCTSRSARSRPFSANAPRSASVQPLSGLLLEHARQCCSRRGSDLRSPLRRSSRHGAPRARRSRRGRAAPRPCGRRSARARLDVLRPGVSPKVALDARQRRVRRQRLRRRRRTPRRPRSRRSRRCSPATDCDKDLPEGIENRRIAVAEPANERCRPVHVGKDERDRAVGQVRSAFVRRRSAPTRARRGRRSRALRARPARRTSGRDACPSAPSVAAGAGARARVQGRAP